MAIKERQPSAAERKIEDACDWLRGESFGDCAAQAECAHALKEKFKLTREQIGRVMSLSTRQVLTRLAQYKRYVATGEIPSKEFADKGFTSKPGAFHELVEDEAERRVGAYALKEAKELVGSEILLDKLAAKLGPHLPTKSDLARIDRLFRSTRTKKVRGKKEEIAVATMSDLHLCLDTHDHNYARGIQANATFVQKVIDLTELHRSQCDVRTLHVNALGDLIQGTANYPSQRWDVDRPAVDQAEALVAVMVRNLETWLLHFETVVVNWANGNHEYLVGKKQTTDPEHSSWGQVAVRALMWAFRHNKRVIFNVPVTWYQIVDIAGSRFMLTHGHAMPGSGSFDGIVSTARKWADIVAPFDYLVCGHFHRLAKLPLPKAHGSALQRAVYLNGTAVGGDDFLEKMGGSPVTQWWLLFVRQGRGVTAEYSIDLYDAE